MTEFSSEDAAVKLTSTEQADISRSTNSGAGQVVT